METVSICGKLYRTEKASGICQGCCFFHSDVEGNYHASCGKHDHGVRCNSIIFKQIEKEKTEFEIGDDVIIVKSCNKIAHEFKVGTEGKIMETWDNGFHGILYSVSANGYCAKYWVKPEDIILKQKQKSEKMEKEIKIVPPEGYEIDKENSTLECIKFKATSQKPANCPLAITQFKLGYSEECHINGRWAFSAYATEKDGGSKGEEMSGHKGIMFLASSQGTWYDDKGNKLGGTLYYKPKK